MGKKIKPTYFFRKWCIDPEFSGWICESTNTKQFGCRQCKKHIIALSNMGIEALRSHARSKKHDENIKLWKNKKKKAFFQNCSKAAMD